MRPAARWMSVATMLCATAAPGLMAAAPAWADTTRPTVTGTNWYWAGKDGATSTTPAGNGPFAAPDPASGIPAGDLGVAYTNDLDKVAAVNFGFSVPANSTVSRFAVVMPLDPSASNLSAKDGPPLVACPAIEAWQPGAGPTELSKAPAQALNVCADGKYDAAKKTYTFDIATVADDWAAGSAGNGVVIRPKQGDGTSFNYAFQGAKAITVTADYLPGAAAATPTQAPAAPAAAGAGLAVPPTGFSSGGTGSTPALPEAPISQPLTAPQPQVMPPAAPVVAAPASAATRAAAESLRPTAWFWLFAVALAAMVLLTGLVLGDPLEPEAFDNRRRRFADVVRARVAARASAAAAPAAPRARPA